MNPKKDRSVLHNAIELRLPLEGIYQLNLITLGK